MDCHDAQAEMTAYLNGELATEDVRAVENHVASCAGCRAELAALRQAWETLVGLPAPSLAAGIDLWILQRVATEAAETPPPSISSVCWWGVGVAALAAAALSIGNSLALPYETAFQWCSRTIRGYPLLSDLSDGSLFFGIGIFYGLVPLFPVGLFSGRLLGGRPLFHGAVASSVFALFIVPYVLIVCSGLPGLFTLSFMAGILVGALSGGVAGFWAGTCRLRLAHCRNHCVCSTQGPERPRREPMPVTFCTG